MLATYSSTLPPLSHFPHVLPCSLFATMVCASLSLYCKYGRTALMWASKGGYTAIVELLLGAGADKEVKDEVREGMRENYTRARAYD